MKNIISCCILGLLIVHSIKGQILDPYQLQCEFDFTNGVHCMESSCTDFDTLNVVHDPQKGIYVNGIYRFSGGPDGSFLGNKKIDRLSDSCIALELEFIADHPGYAPLIVIGNSWRELFVEIERDSILAIRSGDQFLRTSGRIQQNQLHNLKITTWYTPSGTTTKIFLDDQDLGELHGQLNIRDSDLALSNTHGGDGTAFKGWWKSLKVYSTNDFTLSTQNQFKTLEVFPNPVTQHQIQIATPHLYQNECQVINQMGEIRNAEIVEGKVNLRDFPNGLYIIKIEGKNNTYLTKILLGN